MQVKRLDAHLGKNKKRQLIGLLLCILLLLGLFGLLVNRAINSSATEALVSSRLESNLNPSPLNDYTGFVVNVREEMESIASIETSTPTQTATSQPFATTAPTEKAVLQQSDAIVEEENSEITITPTATATPAESSELITPTASPTPNILILSPVADAFVSAQRTSENFGRLSTLDLETSLSEVYLRFEVPELPTSLADVILRLRLDDANTSDVALFSVEDDSWVELEINYDNAPEMGTMLSRSSGARANSWVEIDVTQYVTEAGLVSFGLQTLNPTQFEFLSRESDNPPELILMFGDRDDEIAGDGTQTATPTVASTIEPTATEMAPTETPTPDTPVVPTATPTDFPISIQPTPTETPEPVMTTITNTAVADTFVHVLQPNVNYGTLNYISLDASPTKNGLLRFDLDEFAGSVDRAVLRIYSHDELDDGISVFNVDDDSWIEDDVTFSSVPSFGSLLGEVGSVEENAWIEIELSTAVIESGLISFGLTSEAVSSMELSTRETSRAPELVISIVDYQPALPAPPPPAPPPPVPPSHCDELAGNVIQNGNFTSNTSEWSFYSDGDVDFETAVPEPTYCDSVAQFSISEAGSNVQIYQSGLTLNANTSYTLRFAAKSNSGNDMSLYLQKHEPNYQHYGLNGEVVDLTTEWQLFEIVFTTENFTGQVNNGRLRFWFAPFDQAGDIYWFDHIELIEN